MCSVETKNIYDSVSSDFQCWEVNGMTYNGKKWICFVIAICWAITAVIRVFEKSPAGVIVISFVAAIIFFGMGVFYFYKNKK